MPLRLVIDGVRRHSNHAHTATIEERFSPGNARVLSSVDSSAEVLVVRAHDRPEFILSAAGVWHLGKDALVLAGDCLQHLGSLRDVVAKGVREIHRGLADCVP
jgi:hypothetical protein